MTYFFIFLLAVVWFMFVCILLWSGQTSKACVKQRFFRMLEEADDLKKISEVYPLQNNNFVEIETATPHKNFSETSVVERVFRPLFNNISKFLSKFAPNELKSMLEFQIFRMGMQDHWSVIHLAAFWVLSVGVGIFISFIAIKNNFDLQFQQQFIIMVLGTIAGAIIPFFILQSFIRRRKENLRKQMPEFMDLICISVQAGLSFDGAVSKITGRMKNDLSDEFKRMQRDIRNGMSRQRSLTQMAKRCDIEEMYLFTSSIIQADKLGTSMSRTLKIQADNIRDRYRQAKRAEVLKAPIKIIFPIVIFILPSIFVVTLLPFLLSLVNSLGK